MRTSNSRRSAASPLVRTLDASMPAEAMSPLPSTPSGRISVPEEDGPPGSSSPELEVPPMRVVVMLTGTQGDTMPFIQIAHMMQERYGHVVRIATHDDLRGPVEKAGLRFFPMRGNSMKMASWGPSFSLHLPTLIKLSLDPKTTTKLYIFRKIILATIRACTAPDPADQSAEPFHADAIMANPMALGHLHCAEALGVPLHLYFPNPWVVTTEYPHSFSGWQYPSRPSAERPNGFEWEPKAANAWSYHIVAFFLWHAFLPSFNELRAVCGLRTLRFGFAGSTVVADQKIPFSQMWSPSLSPRPLDWPEQVSVTGFFFWDQKAAEVDESSPEYAPVVAWLARGEKPIYIGFGSMVFPGLQTARLIVEAARASGRRVLMQTSNAGGILELPQSELPDNVFCIGRCAHEWLLPKMAAVIHHGGAGTVGAGLRLALPSMCCPFFGDQFFYGHCVAASGCGPPPLPFNQLTVGALAHALADILEPRYAAGAARMAARINAEQGLENGLRDFNRQLPLADMVCEVATLMHEKGLARVYYPALRIKARALSPDAPTRWRTPVSDEVDATLRSSRAIDTRMLAGARPHRTREWELGSHVRDPCTGLYAGALALVWELLDATFSIVTLPLKSAYHNGLAGFLLGLAAAFALLLARLIYAPMILCDRVVTGVANWHCCPWGVAARSAMSDSAIKPLDHVLDPEPALNRCSQFPRGKEPLCGPRSVRSDAGHADGLSRHPLHGPVYAADGERREAIEAAFTQVVALRRAFDALDASSNDDALSATEVATLDEPATAPAALPVGDTQRLGEAINRYMRRHGRRHLAFAEFVLLSRDQANAL